MINHLILQGLEKAINAYLHLDPQVERLIQPLAGRIIIVKFSDLPIQLNYTFDQQRILLLSNDPGFFDAKLTGSVWNFLAMQRAEETTEFLTSGKIQLEGNTELAAQFGDVFRNLDIDWEEHLAKVVGDPIAHSVGNCIRNTFNWGQQSIDGLQQSFTEYVQEEIHCFPSRLEIKDFLTDVDQIRLDIDRLDARVARLKGEEK